MSDWFASASAKINSVVEGIVAVLMLSLVLDVWLGVVDRYYFHWQLPWPEVLARYLMIWAALLAVSSGIAPQGPHRIDCIHHDTSRRFASYSVGCDGRFGAGFVLIRRTFWDQLRRKRSSPPSDDFWRQPCSVLRSHSRRGGTVICTTGAGPVSGFWVAY